MSWDIQFLGIHVSNYRTIYEEAGKQTTKEARISGYFRDAIYKNKHLIPEDDVRPRV